MITRYLLSRNESADAGGYIGCGFPATAPATDRLCATGEDLQTGERLTPPLGFVEDDGDDLRIAFPRPIHTRSASSRNVSRNVNAEGGECADFGGPPSAARRRPLGRLSFHEEATEDRDY